MLSEGTAFDPAAIKVRKTDRFQLFSEENILKGFLSNFAQLNIFVHAGTIWFGSNLILIFYAFKLFLIMNKKKLSFIAPKTLPKTETVVSEDKSENDKNKG